MEEGDIMTRSFYGPKVVLDFQASLTNPKGFSKSAVLLVIKQTEPEDRVKNPEGFFKWVRQVGFYEVTKFLDRFGPKALAAYWIRLNAWYDAKIKKIDDGDEAVKNFKGDCQAVLGHFSFVGH
ncbi:MAG: hypothetical protein A3C58_01320 [Candidatus Staskawiczbacteria bacterium RIFCSPHIGHO2_02_FULL_34_10]|uniref:Uncharacterized protein n=1 Tax=Candidatus Staskawiczbacteria bacterium RIFCSPHIGHO2_02_FULL_34_10 TaxID=1802205 RepID=A0A1G2HZ43_9BACT|nr:MAG: hypothetical protein A3C58_01320 [Candidatus Staskawiczbacteria bacterium RIFCSPHIGHO2_02_FULL_34_10]